MTQNKWLKLLGGVDGIKCFDCWLLKAQLKQKEEEREAQELYNAEMGAIIQDGLNPMNIQ